MGRIVVNPEELESLAGQVRHADGDFQALHGALRSMVGGMTWEARAVADLEGRMDEVNHLLGRVTDCIGTMEQFLRQKAQEFREADDRGSLAGRVLGLVSKLLAPIGLVAKEVWAGIQRVMQLGRLLTFQDFTPAVVLGVPWFLGLLDRGSAPPFTPQPGAAVVPQAVPGPEPGTERVPNADELKLIQWTYGIKEDGYGPETQAKMREVQQQHGIPIDPSVAIGAVTWGLVMSDYRNKVAGGAPASQTDVPAPDKPATADTDALLAKYFPNEAERQILKHTMSEEGPAKFGANWGAVVYRTKHGLVCDRNWINFGLISFAYPSGSGGDVLKKLLSDPAEETAFRSIAERMLTDNPGGEVPEEWRHLLNDPSHYTIAPKSKQELIDEFVANIKSGDGHAGQDFMFKYLNTPAKQQGVATGEMRNDWHGALSEFLARPASEAAQLNVAREQYFDPAVAAAEKFGVKTVRGVGFFFDVTVQEGGPTADMLTKLATTRFQQASEMERLEILRDTFPEGTTEWNRRDSVIHSQVLTDEPYLR